FIGLFPDNAGSAPEKAKGVYDDLTIEEKLKRHIIDGEKRNLTQDLDVALKSYSALDIINNLLLDGMKVVGDLFGSGQMQLPFVLQSAEAMKAAVKFLEPFMEKADSTNKGYKVVNLGIKQPIDEILNSWQETGADAIGMSGLLVKSTLVMRDNLE